MTTSEMMTIMIYFHQLRFRDFKTYYQHYVQIHLREFFPKVVSYTRMVELMPSVLLPLCFFIHSQPKTHTDIYFIDAMTLDVCHVKRASSHKVFKGLAKKGKSSMGWFFGFKLHLVINDKGEIMTFKITKGNIDDRKPVNFLTQGLLGKLIGKGYLSQALFTPSINEDCNCLLKLKRI